MLNVKNCQHFIVGMLFLIICIMSTVDTHLFVYPSLSRYLWLEIGIAVLSFICLISSVLKSSVFTFSFTSVFISVWIAYVFLHGCFALVSEHYRTLYLCLTLLFALTLAHSQRVGLISRFEIENVLLFIAVIHILFIIGQSFGILNSGNVFFRFTGCNENPTVTALYLTGCIPLITNRLVSSKYKVVYAVMLLLSLIAVLLLRCRAAYVGVIVVFSISIFTSANLKQYKYGKTPILLVVILLFTILVPVCLKMYEMKKNSADGRLLIWRLSTSMIIERPSGYGYGLFERYYNLRQADYFANNYSPIEANNADHVYMAYNDYLEHGVEGGIVGMFFLFTFYAIMIWKSVRKRKKQDVAVFSSFAIMSLFNFVYTSIMPWILLMCYASFVVLEDKCKYKALPHFSYIGAMLFVVLVLMTGKLSRMIDAQLQLKKISSDSVNDESFARLEDCISTSEAFWQIRAINNFKNKRYMYALENIQQAQKYSSSPQLFLLKIYCLKSIGQTDEAERCFDTLRNMVPHKYSRTIKNIKL